MADGFARIYTARLLFDQSRSVTHADMLAALRRHCGTVEPMGKADGTGPMMFAYPDHPVTYENGRVPAQSLIDLVPAPPIETMGNDLKQCWDWREASTIVPRCRSALLVTDFMASGLAYAERLTLFQAIVSAALDVAPCAAIHWVASQRFVAPDAYRAAQSGDGIADRIYPAINVRLFNVTDRAAGETLMDTIGLAALGLPDLQCHFVGLDVNAVSLVLYNSAYYIFERGDVIADGHTIQGIEPKDRWRCRHEDSMVEPGRVVLDLDPGAPFAAGGRP